MKTYDNDTDEWSFLDGPRSPMPYLGKQYAQKYHIEDVPARQFHTTGDRTDSPHDKWTKTGTDIFYVS
jgi:hypothetical protein